MPNYDEVSHDMSFTLGGETFEVHDVSPDIIEAWEREEEAALLAAGEPEAQNGQPSETTMQRLDRHILSFMEGDPDMVKRYKALRKRKGKESVPAWKIVEFHNDLYKTQSGRPTPPPAPSAPGVGQTARTSGAA